MVEVVPQSYIVVWYSASEDRKLHHDGLFVKDQGHSRTNKDINSQLQRPVCFFLVFHVLPPFKERLESQTLLSPTDFPSSLNFIVWYTTDALFPSLLCEEINLSSIITALK